MKKTNRALSAKIDSLKTELKWLEKDLNIGSKKKDLKKLKDLLIQLQTFLTLEKIYLFERKSVLKI